MTFQEWGDAGVRRAGFEGRIARIPSLFGRASVMLDSSTHFRFPSWQTYKDVMALVLVIDDHDDTRYVVQRLLGQWGHRTLEAVTGETGLAIVAAEKPDLIIVDAMMPGMNGAEFIRLVRANMETALVPIVLYTAIADPDFTDNALGKGANEIWIKGQITMEQMKDRVAKYVKS